MNYWLLTTEYPPFFGGGISTYCYQTAQMLSAKDHSVTVFVNDAGITGIHEEKRESIRIIRFNPSATRSSDFLGHVTNISYEFAYIIKAYADKEGQPDIIEAQEYLGIAYYLLQFKRLGYDWCRNIPILITMHSPSFLYMEYNHVPQYRYPNYWICEMERFCLQAADHIISPSNYMINELGQRFTLSHDRISTVPNPYQVKTMPQISLAGDNHSGEIVFYGKLTVQKGAFRLLDYFSDLWNKGFQRPLYLLGGQDIVYHAEGLSMGELIRKKYKKYIGSGLLKLESTIKPSSIADRLSKAEVVIIPSNNDNLPYVVLEMMALGKVVLASKQGGQAEVISHGTDGFIFDHEEQDSFSQRMHHILSLGKPERKRIAANAMLKIRDQYNYESIYSRKKKVIDQLILNRNDFPANFPFVRPASPVQTTPGSGYTPELLSIVVPFFNMGKYIDETITSVRQSDYKYKEVIIVNDGSSDQGSLAVLNSFRNAEGIKVIDTPNNGLAAARNLGATQSSGQYLAFLDADDTVLPEYYSRAIAILKIYQNVHFAGSWTQYFEGSNKIWPGFLPEPPLILFHNMINSSSLVYKRMSFLDGGMNDKNMLFPGLEDYNSVLSMISKGLGGVVLPKVLFRYRVRTDSMIRGISKTKKLILYQHIAGKHKELYAGYSVELFNLLNANGPGIRLDNPTLDLHLADNLPFGGAASRKIIRLIKRNKHAKTAAYKIYRFLKK